MPDKKSKRGGSTDRSRVSANEDHELRYMAQKAGVSTDEVRNAIQQVGNDRRKVEEYLQSHKGERGSS
jgi:hypothetical protein